MKKYAVLHIKGSVVNVVKKCGSLRGCEEILAFGRKERDMTKKMSVAEATEKKHQEIISFINSNEGLKEDLSFQCSLLNAIKLCVDIHKNELDIGMIYVIRYLKGILACQEDEKKERDRE